MKTIKLLNKSKCLYEYVLKTEGFELPKKPPVFNRIALSAAHVVLDPIKTQNPFDNPVIDMESTLAYREFLLSTGMGIAEAMDTAQRGMGLNWKDSLTLIEETLKAFPNQAPKKIYSGVGTDHLDINTEDICMNDIIYAYRLQIEAVQKLGGNLIIMASRALAKNAKTISEYTKVYAEILKSVDKPVILHWLGDMFDPALSGYWGEKELDAAMEACLSIIGENQQKIRGIKISLLDKKKEIVMRRRLPGSVRMFTGDDFNYPELIYGDEDGYSEALLGIFDAIAPVACKALTKLATGEKKSYFSLMDSTVPLSRHIFQNPTRYYKTGIVFLAYLNNFQNHFCMVGGQQGARSILHFCEIFRLADQANLLRDADIAINRMYKLMEVHGIIV